VRTGLGVAGTAVREALGGSGSTRGSDARESEKWEKERAGPNTIPAYVHRADTSADEHKQGGLRGGHGSLCSCYDVGLKTNECNSKYESWPRRT
jgi:hypothetical protein